VWKEGRKEAASQSQFVFFVVVLVVVGRRSSVVGRLPV
jgi:hypothetical protein